MKRVLLAAATAALLGGLGVFFFVVPPRAEQSRNALHHPPPYRASEAARALHARILVADLHADSLLWDRDLLARGTRGHVDVPRLIEGNVAVQAFTIVTKSPRGQNIDATGDTIDLITPLAIAQRWPPATWRSLTERALHQARRLHAFAAGSNGALTVIRTSEDLRAYLERRRRDAGITAGMLGVEGAHALDGDLGNVERLFEAGVRMMAPTHFFDNDLAGSAHGLRKAGLTDKGREMVRRMEARKMIVDVAHASTRTIDDVLALATRPIVVSHTGVKGTCDNNRNLSDAHLRGIARNGGLIGIGFWEAATCGRDAKAVARAITHAVRVTGPGHVALGSDFDGAIAAPFDATGLAQLTGALLDEGFSAADVERIMGGNVIRFLLDQLP